jgi:hypothetical protein
LLTTHDAGDLIARNLQLARTTVSADESESNRGAGYHAGEIAANIGPTAYLELPETLVLSCRRFRTTLASRPPMPAVPRQAPATSAIDTDVEGGDVAHPPG